MTFFNIFRFWQNEQNEQNEQKPQLLSLVSPRDEVGFRSCFLFWVEGERGSRFGVGGASSHHMPQSYDGRKIDNFGFVGFGPEILTSTFKPHNFARTSRTTEMFADLFRSEGLAIDWMVPGQNLTTGCGDFKNRQNLSRGGRAVFSLFFPFP